MTIFHDELDFQQYLNLMRHYKKRYKVKIYAYCLMSNHVHLLLEAARLVDLYKVMHGLNLAYTHHYKRRYLWNGHLWQDRYKSYVIERDDYLITCINYIEGNPVKAGIVGDSQEYPWCSVRDRTNDSNSELIDPMGTV
jgi:putative transposase